MFHKNLRKLGNKKGTWYWYDLTMFDSICKFLAETFSTDFATWLLGESVELTELCPSELSLEPIRADALILRQSEQVVLHTQPQF